MSRGKKLSRQIARYLGADAETALAKLAETMHAKPDALPSETLALLENLPTFLDIVDQSYDKYEENIDMSERTVAISLQELVETNRSISSMVNSLGQGFLMFDADGICSPVYSLACATMLETVPAGKPIATVLRLTEDRAATFQQLLKLVFAEGHAMSFDEIMHFAPEVYAHSAGLHIRLTYKPELDDDGKLDRIVMIASDVSSQMEAETLAEQRKALFESIARALHDRRSFGSYMHHVNEVVESCSDPHCHWELPALMRELHTLKGGAGMFHLHALVDVLHDTETAVKSFGQALEGNMEPLRPQIEAIQREAGNIDKRFRDLLGIDVFKLKGENFVDKHKLYDFARYLAAHGHQDLQQVYVHQVCAESLVAHLRGFDLLLGDLANQLNKKIKPLKFSGSDVPVLADAYLSFFESLTHIFRNIADHGIEYAPDRTKNGKDEAGQVEITTGVERADGNAFIAIEISDDGCGMDVDKLRRRLQTAEPDKNWENASERELLDAMLTRMISTRDKSTAYSGRGVGLSAVANEIRKLGGTLAIDSTPGKGSAFRIRIPYKLEIA